MPPGRKKKTLSKPKYDVQEDHGHIAQTVMQKLREDFSAVDDVVFISDFLKQDPIVGWVSTGAFLLDCAIGFPYGLGLPMPAIVEIVGQEATLKSATTYAILGNVQRMGGWGNIIDVESSFTHEYGHLAKLAMGPEMLGYTQAARLEDVLRITQRTIDHHFSLAPSMPLAIGIDSLASTTVVEEQETDGYTARAIHARLMAKYLRSGLVSSLYAKVSADSGDELLGRPLIVIFINQLKATMASNPYAAQLDSFGGRGLKYHARVRIELSRIKVLQDDKDEVSVGIRCKAKILKNKVAQDKREAFFDFRYATGIEDFFPVMDFMKEHKAIAMAGVRFVWRDKSYWPGAFREFLRDNPEEWDELRRQCLLVIGKAWRDRTVPLVETEDGDNTKLVLDEG